MELIHKTLDFEVKQVGNPKDRTLEFVGSTADVDRYGDVIEMEGWDLRNYKKNPVFLWTHDYKQPPVGKAVKVGKTEKGLLFQVKFPTAEEYDFADTIYKLYLGGYLRATSVGFRDLEREPITDKEGRQTGFRYKKQELYELSAVPVPANPNALIMAVQKGVVSAQEVEHLTTIANEPDLEEKTAQPPEIDKEEMKPDLLALAGLVEDLKVKIDELAARVTELRPTQDDPARLKGMIREALEEFFQSGAKPADYYSLALNPGSEPEGGKPGGSPGFSQLFTSVKNLHRLVKGE
ncbi:MAG: HK97 family phage prohead protease [Deltaproteobacteria bacterium]|nr:HK97 family phage prohead protease [Deltaproteobacteria bacterium]